MKVTKLKDISLTGGRAITIEDLPEISVKSLRKNLKDKIAVYGVFALLILMLAVIIAGTLPPDANVMPLNVFKYSQIALYLTSMAFVFFCAYKAYINYKLLKRLKI